MFIQCYPSFAKYTFICSYFRSRRYSLKLFSYIPRRSFKLADLMFSPSPFPARIIHISRKNLVDELTPRLSPPAKRISSFHIFTRWTHDAMEWRRLYSLLLREVDLLLFSSRWVLAWSFIAYLYPFALEMLSVEVCYLLVERAFFQEKCVAILMKCIALLISFFWFFLLLSFTCSIKCHSRCIPVVYYLHIIPLTRWIHCALCWSTIFKKSLLALGVCGRLKSVSLFNKTLL